jgi:hypothetical protein
LIEIGPLVLENRIFVLFTLLLLFPLGKGQFPSFEQFRTPAPKDHLCQVWLKLAQRFWKRSRKCKSLQTDGQTDGKTDGRQTKGDQKSSLELSVQVSK